jgi:RNA polymerase sigma-70 factor (ECF subfamily)
VADLRSPAQPDDRPPSGSMIASEADLKQIERLKAGDEEAFSLLVEHYYASMVRIAMIYVPSQEIAEDVVQETWVAVLKGLDRFEGRSSLKTWIFTILTNRAKTRAQRESRYVPLELPDEQDVEPAVPAERFRPGDAPEWANHWWPEMEPKNWDSVPEAHLLSQETLSSIMQAIAALPPNQREVIRLRDVEGFSSTEVCNILSLSETNQRVLLHRARSRVRLALETYMDS